MIDERMEEQAALHVLGALYHLLIVRDRTVQRMV